MSSARSPWPHALCLSVLCSAVAAQESPGAAGNEQGRSLAITPSLDASLSVGNGGATKSGTDVVAQLRPGININSRSGRVRGVLNYSLDAIGHSRSSEPTSLQNSLNASVSAEAVPNWVYVDATANISRRALSAYGQLLPDGSVQTSGNVNEVGSVSLSPYAKGQLGGWAQYEARLTAAATNTRHSIVGDSSNSGASLSLNSPTAMALFGWGLQATHQRSAFRAGRATVSDRAIGSLSFRPEPDLNLTLRGGKETSDVTTFDKRSYGNWGLGATWAPSNRTAVSLDTDHRYFGQSFRVSVDYRTALSSLRYTSTRDASTNSNPNGIGIPQTWYQRISALFASEPDPVLRDLKVLAFLQANNLDPNGITAAGFVTSAVTLQRHDDLTWSYAGKRASLSLGLSRGETSQLDAITTAQGDGTVRQFSYTLTAAYRLTPTAGINLTGSRLVTLGSGTRQGGSLKSLQVGLTDQLGRRLTGSLTARYSSFGGATGAYRDASVTASAGLRF